MTNVYDIFKRLPQGPIWVQTATGIEQTKACLIAMCSKSPGEYFAYDMGQGQVVAECSSACGDIDRSNDTLTNACDRPGGPKRK